MSTQLDTRRLLTYLFIGALALLFALEWGPGSRGCDTGTFAQKDMAATVNGQGISLRDFATQYSQQADQYRRQGIPMELLKQYGIHKQVLDNLVNTELLAQAAEKKGLAADNDDLAKVLRAQTAFQKDGKFDKESYTQYVREYEGTNEVVFEDKLRRQISAQRLMELVESSVAISEDEVKARYLKESDTAKLTFVRFLPAMYADQVKPPTPSEVEVWAKANEKAIAENYEANKFAHFIPEKVKARQIVLKVPPDATEAQKGEIKSRMEALRKDIAEGKKTFADAAKEASEDTETKSTGGDLGQVDRQALPGAFADLLFALKVGETTAPVLTQAGWFLGTIEAKTAPEQKPLESVRLEIATQLLKHERAKAIASLEAQKALLQVKKGKRLAELFPPAAQNANQYTFTQDSKPQAKDTGDFSVSAESIPQLGPSPELSKIIASTKVKGPIEEVLKVGDGLALVVVEDRKLPSDEAFEPQKEQLKIDAIKGKKQFEVRESFLKALKASGTVVTNDQAIEKVIGTSGS